MHKAKSAIVVIAACVIQSYSFADDGNDGDSVPRPASYYYYTHFVNGGLKTENGSTRFPLLHNIEETKIAIFANNTDDGTMKIEKALDALMEKYPQLRYSFMVVGKESDSESMTDDQLEDQLERLRNLAGQYKIKKLSMGCVQYRVGNGFRGRYSLDLLQGADVALAVIEPGIVEPRRKELARRLPTRTVRPFYRHLVRFRQTEPDSTRAADKIEDALKSLLK